MRKKLLATEKDSITVVRTGGGINIELNAGTYELMMQTTEEYFSTVKQGVKYQRFSVKDKNGLEVERIFKATKGKQSLYTINMYHTTCICLVNGKQSKYFMDNDLKEIMSLMQHKIYGTSLEEVNDSIRDIVLSIIQLKMKR